MENRFALFFHNFLTFLGRAGLYLEDLYILEDYRGRATMEGDAARTGASRKNADAAGWNGGAWTGTNEASTSICPWAHSPPDESDEPIA